jgi:hypothetical protein
MSQEKIKIALIGGNKAVTVTKPIISSFAQTYNTAKKQEAVQPSSSPYVLQNFSFEGCQIEIIEVSRNDQNPPRCDGVIWTTGIVEASLNDQKEIETVEGEETEDPWEKSLNRLKTLQPPLPKDVVSFETPLENPYLALAEKMGCHGEKRREVQLSRKKPDSTSATRDENYHLIDANLRAIIRLKQLDALILDAQKGPWYKKSRVTLVFALLCLLVSVGLFTGLVLTGLLLTPFLALPIAFLIMVVAFSIKIAYDNRRPPLISHTADNPVSKPTTGNQQQQVSIGLQSGSVLSASHIAQASGKTENLDIGQLLFCVMDNKVDRVGIYKCLGEFFELGENSSKTFKSFNPREIQHATSIFPDWGLDFPTVSFEITAGKHSTIILYVPLCIENAPIIRKIINEDSLNFGSSDLKNSILKQLDTPLKSIPAEQLDPDYTKSLSTQQRLSL